MGYERQKISNNQKNTITIINDNKHKQNQDTEITYGQTHLINNCVSAGILEIVFHQIISLQSPWKRYSPEMVTGLGIISGTKGY